MVTRTASSSRTTHAEELATSRGAHASPSSRSIDAFWATRSTVALAPDAAAASSNQSPPDPRPPPRARTSSNVGGGRPDDGHDARRVEAEAEAEADAAPWARRKSAEMFATTCGCAVFSGTEYVHVDPDADAAGEEAAGRGVDG